MIVPGHWLRGLLVAAVLACATPAAQSGDVKVAFINPNNPPEFWQLVCTTMKAAAAELGIDVEIRDWNWSREKAIAYLAGKPRAVNALGFSFCGASVSELTSSAAYRYNPASLLGR